MPGHCPKRPRDHHHARHLARGGLHDGCPHPLLPRQAGRDRRGVPRGVGGLVRRAAQPAGVGGRARGAAGDAREPRAAGRPRPPRGVAALVRDVDVRRPRPRLRRPAGRDRRPLGARDPGCAGAGPRGRPARKHRRGRRGRGACAPDRRPRPARVARRQLGGRPRAPRASHGHARGARPGAAQDAHRTRAADERPAHADRGRDARDRRGGASGRRRDRGRPCRRDRRPRNGRRGRRADRCVRARGDARRDRHARPLRGSGPHRARGLHDGHDGRRGRRLHDRDGAPAHLPARDDRRALPPEARDGAPEGRRRLRALGRAHRAVPARDQRPVAGGRPWLQGVHAGLRPVVPQRHRRRVPRGHAAREGGRRPGARPRRERLAAPGRDRPDGVRRAGATRWHITSPVPRSSRRKRCTARCTSRRMPGYASRSSTSRARSAQISSGARRRTDGP